MPQEKEVVCFASCPAIRKILNHKKKVLFYTLKANKQKAKPTPHTLLDSDVGTKTPVFATRLISFCYLHHGEIA